MNFISPFWILIPFSLMLILTESKKFGSINLGEEIIWYKRIFGSSINATCNSQKTLNEIFKRTEELAIKDSSFGRLGFACSNYSQGKEIAKESRSQSPSPIVPIYVDRDEDAICFLCFNFTKILIDFSFQVYLPSALKVDDSIYKIMEASNFPIKNLIMSISFRPELFGASLSEINSNIENYFFQKFSSLTTYETEPFKDFFWTDPSVEKEYFNKPNVNNFDRGRHELWKAKYLTYLEINSNNDREYSYQSSQDPCSFKILQESYTIAEGEISFPLLGILTSDSVERSSSCLAALAVIFSVDETVNHVSIHSSAELLNFRGRSILESGTVGSSLNNQPFTSAGLLGDNQIISIADTGVDSFSCYFYDSQGQVTPTLLTNPSYDLKYRKIIQYLYNGCGDTSDAQGGHGTHVSGIATGNMQNADISKGGKYDGMAPNAKLSFMDLGKPGTGLCIPSPVQLYGPGYIAGARVHSNSWGSQFTGNGYYSSQATDEYLYKNQAISVFFAAGNSGGNGNGDKTITMEGTAKNIITVGSSETTLGSSDIHYVAFYSSKGPTYDRRIKPDLVSTGDSLLSANAAGSNKQTCSTIQMTGTSMATPSAAGIALLVRQYFIDPDSKFWRAVCNHSYRSCTSMIPSGVLVKAILLHSGEPMTLFNGGGSYDVPLGDPPDFMQGFGRIGLMNVLPLPNLNKFDLFIANSVNLQEDSSTQYSVNIENSDILLKVTIVWNDPPNVQGTTSKSLIDDLDLLLISPQGKKVYPNGLTGRDTVNNVEKTIVSNPTKGIWKVIISANALPYSGNQLFSIVITSGGAVTYS